MINEKVRKEELKYKDKPLLNFRFPVEEDLYLASKIDGGTHMLQPNTKYEPSDISLQGSKINGPGQQEGASKFFDLLVNNPILGARSTSSGQTSQSEDHRIRHEKLKEHLMNTTKTKNPFDSFNKGIDDSTCIAEFTKDECEKSRSVLSSDQEKRAKSATNNGVESASVAESVQSALSALQAGQLSLNQVS